MKLEELKEQLDTEARQQVTKLEFRIRGLNRTISDLTAQLKVMSDNVYALQSRCRVLTKGTLCLFCNMKATCKPHQGVPKDG